MVNIVGNKKTYLAVVIILSISVVLVVASIVWFRNKPGVAQLPQKILPVPIPALPQNTLQEFDENKNAKELYQDAYNKAQTTGNENISEVFFYNENGQFISLSNFVRDMGIKIPSEIAGDLDQKVYSVFFCPRPSGGQSIGLRVELINKVESFKKNQMVLQMPDRLFRWEKSLFFDLKPLFYPNTTIDSSIEPRFSSTEYTSENGMNVVTVRYVNVRSTAGENLSLDYTYFNEQTFLSNSKDCLRKMVDLYQDEAGS